MTGLGVALVVTVGVAALAAVVWVACAPLNPGAYVVRRSPERPAPLMAATLTRSHRGLPGGPPPAGTAAPVHVITDCPAATGARANREG